MELRVRTLEEKVGQVNRKLDSFESRIARLEQKNDIVPPKGEGVRKVKAGTRTRRGLRPHPIMQCAPTPPSLPVPHSPSHAELIGAGSHLEC
jgi:hypothetical protein